MVIGVEQDSPENPGAHKHFPLRQIPFPLHYKGHLFIAQIFLKDLGQVKYPS